MSASWIPWEGESARLHPIKWCGSDCEIRLILTEKQALLVGCESPDSPQSEIVAYQLIEDHFDPDFDPVKAEEGWQAERSDLINEITALRSELERKTEALEKALKALDHALVNHREESTAFQQETYRALSSGHATPVQQRAAASGIALQKALEGRVHELRGSVSAALTPNPNEGGAS